MYILGDPGVASRDDAIFSASILIIASPENIAISRLAAPGFPSMRRLLN